MASFTARRRAGRGVSAAYLEQRDYIVKCARKLYEERGVGKTTLADIAREASMTRELLYYYFSGKEDITKNVLEAYATDAIDVACLWCDTWYERYKDWDGEGDFGWEALCDAVANIRRFKYAHDDVYNPMFVVMCEVGVREAFVNRVCRDLSEELFHRPSGWLLRDGIGWGEGERFMDFCSFTIFGVNGLIGNGLERDDGAIADVLVTLLQASKLRPRLNPLPDEGVSAGS